MDKVRVIEIDDLLPMPNWSVYTAVSIFKQHKSSRDVLKVSWGYPLDIFRTSLGNLRYLGHHYLGNTDTRENIEVRTSDAIQRHKCLIIHKSAQLAPSSLDVRPLADYPIYHPAGRSRRVQQPRSCAGVSQPAPAFLSTSPKSPPVTPEGRSGSASTLRTLVRETSPYPCSSRDLRGDELPALA